MYGRGGVFSTPQALLHDSFRGVLWSDGLSTVSTAASTGCFAARGVSEMSIRECDYMYLSTCEM